MKPQIVLLLLFIGMMLAIALWIEFKVHKTKIRVGRKVWMYAGGLVILLFAFCSSVHVITNQGRFILKDHFTLRYTFITSDDMIILHKSCVESLGTSEDCKLARRLSE